MTHFQHGPTVQLFFKCLEVRNSPPTDPAALHAMAYYALALPSPPRLALGSTQPKVGGRARGLGHHCSAAAAGAVVGCTAGALASVTTPPPRRSANYRPTMWSDSFIQTLTSDRMGRDQMEKHEDLKSRVRCLFAEAAGAAAKLQLLDDVQRLGVAYHFEQEIGLMLQSLSANLGVVRRELDGDLFHTALLFRILREHGHPVPQDVFDNLVDERRNFVGFLEDDVKGMLNLYEATFLAFERETALDDARAFSSAYLTEFIVDNGVDTKLKEMVRYALEMPLRWRAPRAHTRWFIDASTEVNERPFLFEFAKLDFNNLQRVHVREIKDLSRWWENLGLQKLSFSRNRLVESFLSALEVTGAAPELECCRCGLTKINQLIAAIDDIYDVYGSLDELEAFTVAVERWDLKEMEELPNYMKVCLWALVHTTIELAHQCFKRSNFNCLSYLQKSWIHMCKCFLLEARWYHGKHMPTFDEYMKNAWVTISGPLTLVHAYFLLCENITKEDSKSIEEYCNIIQWSSTIARINNDLGTSAVESERDIPKSVQCYMYERNAPEVVAQEHIKALVSNIWKKVNEESSLNKHLPKSIINAAINIVRTSHCIYQHGDGFGTPDMETKSLINLLLIEPIY